MSSERNFFLLVFVVLILNGTKACFTNTFQSFSVPTGGSFYKECQCDTEPGHIITSLQWLNNYGAPIQTGPGTSAKMYTEEQDGNLNLHIPYITKTMSGTYQCVALVNGKKYSQNYKIFAYDPLYFYDTPVDQHLVYGKTSSIKCQPKSDFHVIIHWYKVNEKEEQIELTDDEKYVLKNDELIVHNVSQNDGGIYKCTAQVYDTSEDVDKFITVKILTEPKIKHIKSNPENTTVVAGSHLMIECIADGWPHPEYFWNKTIQVTDLPESNVTWHQEINTIIFDKIKPEDRGIYACYAYNLAGTSTMKISVEVLFPPFMTMAFSNVTALEGSTVQIMCNASGRPDPKIYITFEGRELHDDLNEIELKDSDIIPNMHVMRVERSNEGFYYCNADNEVGSAQELMYLSVLHRPYVVGEGIEKVWGWEGKTLNLTCENESNPPASVTWRFQGNNILAEEEVEINKNLLIILKDMTEPYFTMTIDNETAYGNYECMATNIYGQAMKRFILIQGYRPGRVSNITIVDLTATSVTFDMQGPEYVEGPEVIGFTATYDEEQNYDITDIHINRTWAKGVPYKLDKLKPDTKYYVQLAAVNEVGAGYWSDYYYFTTLDKSVPEPPAWEEEPITLSKDSHVLKWRAPDDNGEPIDHYNLTYCPEDDEEACKSLRIDKGTELKLVDLEFNTTYLLELKAHNSQGYSLPANVSIVVPAPSVNAPTTQLSGGAIIGISIVIVLVCLLLLDVLLLVWRRQGIIAMCCLKKDNKRKESPLNSRDKKGLLNGESEDRGANVQNNSHKEFQYNKNTGVVTGKHSSV